MHLSCNLASNSLGEYKIESQSIVVEEEGKNKEEGCSKRDQKYQNAGFFSKKLLELPPIGPTASRGGSPPLWLFGLWLLGHLWVYIYTSLVTWGPRYMIPTWTLETYPK